MLEYRVIDLDTETIDPEPRTVSASSPERAAEQVLGEKLVRGGSKQDLRARVYFRHAGQSISMVRLYRQAGGQRQL